MTVNLGAGATISGSGTCSSGGGYTVSSNITLPSHADSLSLVAGDQVTITANDHAGQTKYLVKGQSSVYPKIALGGCESGSPINGYKGNSVCHVVMRNPATPNATQPGQAILTSNGGSCAATGQPEFSASLEIADPGYANYHLMNQHVYLDQTQTPVVITPCSSSPWHRTFTESIDTVNGTGSVDFPNEATVQSKQICLADGTNCPTSLNHGEIYGQTGALSSISTVTFSPTLMNVSATAANITAIANGFTCSINPVFTLEDCNTNPTCTSPTAVGSVTLGAVNTPTQGTISNATITAGHWYEWQYTAGSCTTIQAQGTVRY